MKQRFSSLLLRVGSFLLHRGGHAALAAQFNAAAGDATSYRQAQDLMTAGRFEAAAEVVRQVLQAQPKHAEAHNLSAALLLQAGDFDAAAGHLEQALAIRRNFPEALNNLGNVWLAKNDLGQAASAYRAALAARCDYPEALTNLGSCLTMLGENGEAESCCRRAVELAPRFAGAHCNLGNALLSQGALGEAIAAYRTALELQPELVEAKINLALATEDSNWLVGTLDYFEEQLQRHPDSSLPHLRIAQALQALNRWDEARERLRRAIAIDEGAADVWNLLGHNHAHAGEIPEAIACLKRAQHSGFRAATESSLLFNSLYLPGIDAAKLAAEFRHWADRCFGQPPPPPARLPAAARRLKIGYVSRDFCRHSVAFFLEPILAHHHHGHFEIFCYSNLLRPDATTERLRALADEWRDISTLSTAQAVAQIRLDAIDILVDLSGHTAGGRLPIFAARPAPVQLTYLGHPATTGLAAIDYRLCDAISDPPRTTERHHAETLWRLPGCFLTYLPAADAPAVQSAPCTRGAAPTLASFNNVAKINGQVIAVWSRILQALPAARLLLKGFAFATTSGRARVEDRFAAHGIAAERLQLVDWLPEGSHHLALYNQVDVALDPFPYNGTTTTCEALWMGVPVVCLVGDRHAARVGASLMDALGLQELVASDEDAYVRLVVALVSDPQRLSALRQSLRTRMQASALLDHAGFVRKLERAYRTMWQAGGETDGECIEAHGLPVGPAQDL